MSNTEYERGLLEGELRAVREILHQHHERLDKHDERFEKSDIRMRNIERVIYALTGAYAVIQFLPAIKGAIGVA